MERLKAGTESQAMVRTLQQYARRPGEGDAGRTFARRVLAAAGVSWDESDAGRESAAGGGDR